MVALQGEHSGRRILGQDGEDFVLILCLWTVPTDVYATPGDSDDLFEINSALGETYVHEFNPYGLTDHA